MLFSNKTNSFQKTNETINISKIFSTLLCYKIDSDNKEK